MKIVIAGGGRIGGVLAARLVAEQHTVTVVERDAATCKRLFEEVGVVTVCGDATDPQVLESAGVLGADVAAGVLARDAENLAFATLVRSMSRARVMVRMLDTRYREAYRLAGVTELVAEAEVVVAKMTTSLDFPQVAGSLPLAGGAILFELPVGPRALVAGRTVEQVRSLRGFPRECVFIGLVHPEGNIELPDGKTVLRAGQTAILVARRAELAQAVECLTAEPAENNLAGPLAGLLRRVDFLAPLSDEEVLGVARGAEFLRKAAGEHIFERGDPGEAFYVVLSGEVQVVAENGRVEERLGPGGFFGELALLTGEPRAMGAVASKDSELAAVGREDFQGVVMANPAVALEMSRRLGQRLSRAAAQQPPGGPKRKGLFGR